MIQKGQWVVMPASMSLELEGIRLSPPGVVPQRDQRPRWICNCTWSGVNTETLPRCQGVNAVWTRSGANLTRDHPCEPSSWSGPVEQDRPKRRVLPDRPYPNDAPKLGVVFPADARVEPIVAVPLLLPMGWVNSPPPAFVTGTKRSQMSQTGGSAGREGISHDSDSPPKAPAPPLPAHIVGASDSKEKRLAPTCLKSEPKKGTTASKKR